VKVWVSQVNLGQHGLLEHCSPPFEQFDTAARARGAVIAMMTGIAASPTVLISARRLSAARASAPPSSSRSADFSSSPSVQLTTASPVAPSP
jgi:hypothetical protein